MKIIKELIAPCGMNCALCLAYQRDKNRCLGCNSNSNAKRSITNHLKTCIIRNCPKLTNSFCYDCQDFPCQRLKNLDKRYKTKYGMSMLDNLNYIKEKGLEDFIKNEQTKWACQSCDSLVCVHRSICLNCQTKYKED